MKLSVPIRFWSWNADEWKVRTNLVVTWYRVCPRILVAMRTAGWGQGSCGMRRRHRSHITSPLKYQRGSLMLTGLTLEKCEERQQAHIRVFGSQTLWRLPVEKVASWEDYWCLEETLTTVIYKSYNEAPRVDSEVEASCTARTTVWGLFCGFWSVWNTLNLSEGTL